MATDILRFYRVRGAFKAVWRTLKKLIWGICYFGPPPSSQHLIYIVDGSTSHPLPSTLSRTAGHINYSKLLCCSHHRRSNQRQNLIIMIKTKSRCINLIQFNIMKHGFLFTQSFDSKPSGHTVYKVPWIFSDFAWIWEIPRPIPKSLTFHDFWSDWNFPDFSHWQTVDTLQWSGIRMGSVGGCCEDGLWSVKWWVP